MNFVAVKYMDEVQPLTENDLYRVRGVDGVEWATRIYRGSAKAKTPEGGFQAVCRRIRERTGLAAMTRDEFIWKTIRCNLRNTGIPVNFGITVGLAFIVGRSWRDRRSTSSPSRT
ncbi:MAG: hypothetical protein C4529_02720 [Deltaproteobacteria bacterium]|nr:MAG: hypothetical protein C4529_02720 [Deltaproteobacteria bacterium]